MSVNIYHFIHRKRIQEIVKLMKTKAKIVQLNRDCDNIYERIKCCNFGDVMIQKNKSY